MVNEKRILTTLAETPFVARLLASMAAVATETHRSRAEVVKLLAAYSGSQYVFLAFEAMVV